MWQLLFTDPLSFFFLFPGLLLSLALHEFAHAWTADKLGDPTPRMQGRVTLNPLAHLDPLGTLAILLTRFGWGKPVQFDPYNLRHPLKDTALIALAGPVTNLIIASVLALLLNFGTLPWFWLQLGVAQLVLINIVLAIFNLIPVYPLDGSKIVLALLPKELAYEYDNLMHQYGTLLLILLIFPWSNGSAPVSYLVSPVVSFLGNILLPGML